MYLTKTPTFIQSLFPNFIWRIDSSKKTLFLTFDDGPVPGITDWVLDILASHSAKATFFCVGENVEKHPLLFNRIKEEGHAIGSHTYHHKNGWQTNKQDYLQDVKKCAELVGSNLFRPPYGRMTPSQALTLKDKYNIVMWDILTGDFDDKLDQDECFQKIIKESKAGSILVFHDSIKAKDNLTNILPRVLNHYTKLGFSFESLSTAISIIDN